MGALDPEAIAMRNREIAEMLNMVDSLRRSVANPVHPSLSASDPIKRQATLSMAVQLAWRQEDMHHVIAAMIINSVESDISPI
jgi:hypothetical protein